MAGVNTFPEILRLYNQCRSAGIWARMALETENGKETITFSSVTRPQGSTFSSVPRPQVPREGKQKKPSKIRKDRERKEAWLAKKILAAGKSAGTENVSIPEHAGYGNSADTCDQQPDKPETETGFVNTACSTYIQPVNLAQEKQHSGLNIKNRADTQGSVDSHSPESQLSEKMDFEKDTDIIPGEKDEHQLCHKCNGDKPWSPVFRSEKPCDTGRCVWEQTEGPEHIPHTQWMKTEHFKDCSINPHHKLNTHLVNVCTCIKCEQVFPINCDPIHCPQAKSKYPCNYISLKK